MTITGKSEFVKLVEKYKCIYPFTHVLLDGDGYILTMKDEVTLNYLEHRNMVQCWKDNRFSDVHDDLHV